MTIISLNFLDSTILDLTVYNKLQYFSTYRHLDQANTDLLRNQYNCIISGYWYS